MRRTIAIVLAAAFALAAVSAALPLHAASPDHESTPRIAVFETFGRESCAICKAASPTVDQMHADYGDQVVVVEHDIDHPTGDRYMKWWTARGSGGTVQTPLVLVNSGLLWTNGSEDFNRIYRRMVDEAVMREPGVSIKSYWEQVDGHTLRVYGNVTNLTGNTLGWWENSAQVNVMIYEDTKVIHTHQFVRAGKAAGLEPDIGPNETADFDIQIDVSGTNQSKMHVVVIVDYRPTGTAWESLNAAFASDEVPAPPTETPIPETPTPRPTFHLNPTAEPTEAPTDAPEISTYTVYLPEVKNQSY